MIQLKQTTQLYRVFGLLFLTILLTDCESTSAVVEYKPPIVPVKLGMSINGRGEIDISVGVSGEIVTPLGVFEIGLVTNPAEQFDVVENTLVVRIDDQDCIYDLKGVNFTVAGLNTEDTYTFVSLTEENKNIFLELKSSSNTGCKQRSVNAKMVETTMPISGNDIPCEGASPSHLHLGDTAHVSYFQVTVHQTPSELAPLSPHKYLRENRTVTLIDGPICGTGDPGYVLFWKVKSEEITFSDGSRGSVVGWIPEESGDIYLLKPR